MGVLSTRVPQTLPPTTRPPCTPGIARDARRYLRSHVRRDREAKLGICTPTLPVRCSGFPPASLRGARRVPRIRFRRRIDTYTARGLARGRLGTRGAIHMLEFACRCRCGGFDDYTICALFSQGILDVEASCRSKGFYLSFPRCFDAGSYHHRSSLPKCSTTHRWRRQRG